MCIAHCACGVCMLVGHPPCRRPRCVRQPTRCVRQPTPAYAHSRSHFAPFFGDSCTKTVHLLFLGSHISNWGQDAPRWSQDIPRWSQDAPKWSPDGPKMEPRCSNLLLFGVSFLMTLLITCLCLLALVCLVFFLIRMHPSHIFSLCGCMLRR